MDDKHEDLQLWRHHLFFNITEGMVNKYIMHCSFSQTITCLFMSDVHLNRRFDQFSKPHFSDLFIGLPSARHCFPALFTKNRFRLSFISQARLQTSEHKQRLGYSTGLNRLTSSERFKEREPVSILCALCFYLSRCCMCFHCAPLCAIRSVNLWWNSCVASRMRTQD